MARDDLLQLPIDHRAGFLLSLLEEEMTVETLLDVSGLPSDETLALLEDLVNQGIIVLI
jgi:hypothetical protein